MKSAGGAPAGAYARPVALPLPLVTVAGAAVGGSMGLFGVGGSSLATPVLSLLAVAPLAAVASPLPATVPSAIVGAWPYLRGGEARPRAAAWSSLGGVPGAVLGALLSRVVGGRALLVASGLVLVLAGWRVLQPIDEAARSVGEQRRKNRPLLVAATFGVGLFSGLLANGGAFLLVPLYLLVFGLSLRQAVGTSLLVVTAFSVPALATHWVLGHIDWAVAAAFAPGQVAGAAVASRLGRRFAAARLSRFFAWFLIAFGALFALVRLVA